MILQTPRKYWKSILAMSVAGVIGAGGFAAPSLAQEANSIRIGMSRGILTFDPQNNSNGGTPLPNVFDALVQMDSDGNFQPHLAKSFTRKSDTVWEFVLNQGVKFHNGEDLTASDVKFTLERLSRETKLLEYPYFSVIEEVKIVDDHTVDIVTKKPDPIFLNRMGRISSAILPEDYIKEHGIEYFTQHPIGSGPYKVASYEVDRQLSLERYEDYFLGKVSDWDKAQILVLPEAASRVNELITGGVDLIDQVPPADWERINSHAGTKVIEVSSNRVISLILNSNEPFTTRDVKVRQAMDYAIDNAVIVNALFDGHGTPTRTHMTPGVLGFDESLYNTYNYDPDKARELLKEAGYDESKPAEVTFQIPRGRYLRDTEMGQLIVAMLEDVGFKVNIEILEGAAHITTVNNNNNKEIAMVGVGNPLFDPYYVANLFDSRVFGARIGYSNPHLHELIDRGLATLDRDERAAIYREIQQIVARDVPFLFVFNMGNFLGMNSDKLEFHPPLNEDVLLKDMVLIKK